MPMKLRRRAVAALAFGLGLLLAGCVTAKKYRLAKDDTPPAQPLGWSISAANADLTLQALIVFKGPGSWKREARWDEYVVTIGNRGSQPLVIESAQLTDLLGQPQLPGEDPWKLEKLSYTNWDKYGKTGLKLLAGAGAVIIYAGAVTAASMGSLLAGPGAAAGGVGALAIIPVVAVVDIGVVAVMNHNNRIKVETEFAKRRLVLPLTIPAGASASGSFFFPMTPGPQRLALRGHSAEQPVELVLELKELAGLHLAPKK